MTSAIDATKPTTGNALTADVRANFAAAAAEISTLQSVGATFPQNMASNLSLACSIAGNALTIAIKTAAGGDPSTASPVRIAFRNSSFIVGDYTIVALTAANSFTISSGSLVGQFGFAFRFWIVAFNDGGTVRLGVINCLSAAASTAAIFHLAGWGVDSSVAEGGAGGADGYWTFYTGTAVTSKPYTILGYLTYEAPLGTPGLYNVLPDRLQLFGPNVPLPGHIIQTGNVIFPEVATGTTVFPSDDTVPLNTSGNEYMSVTVVPSAASNMGVFECHINLSSSAAGTLTSALFSNSSNNALATTANIGESAGRMFQHTIRFARVFGRTTPIILTVRSGNSAAGTTTFNGVAGARLYGGTYGSYVQLSELMA